MVKIYSPIILVLAFSVGVLLLFRNSRYRAMAGARCRLVPTILLSFSILVLTGLLSESMTTDRLQSEMWMTLFILNILTWQRMEIRYVLNICRGCIALYCLMIIYNLCIWSGLLNAFPSSAYQWLPSAEGIVSIIVYISAVWYGMRDIQSVMKSGTVWKNVEVAVTSVYMVTLLGFQVCYLIFPPLLVLIMETGMMIALCARITYDVQFVLRSGYETAIIESLKISQIEMNNGVRPDTYKDLYDRVVEYFEKDKPFLNSRLTINDVVKFVYSNKLYISRAISQYTGRNFCQFVNYYRVMYSVDCFRKNPDLKVAELSEMCGFNSPVTFNLAFHLFMHENPSEWFRKERSRIRKR